MGSFYNIHMVPQNVIDIVEKLNSPSATATEKANYLQRLSVISEYCNLAITKHDNETRKNKR